MKPEILEKIAEGATHIAQTVVAQYADGILESIDGAEERRKAVDFELAQKINNVEGVLNHDRESALENTLRAEKAFKEIIDRLEEVAAEVSKQPGDLSGLKEWVEAQLKAVDVDAQDTDTALEQLKTTVKELSEGIGRNAARSVNVGTELKEVRDELTEVLDAQGCELEAIEERLALSRKAAEAAVDGLKGDIYEIRQRQEAAAEGIGAGFDDVEKRVDELATRQTLGEDDTQARFKRTFERLDTIVNNLQNYGKRCSAAESLVEQARGAMDQWKDDINTRINDLHTSIYARQKNIQADQEQALQQVTALIEERMDTAVSRLAEQAAESRDEGAHAAIDVLRARVDGIQPVPGPEGPRGALEQVRSYRAETVYGKGVVVYDPTNGAAFQAKCNTDSPPGVNGDWQPITCGIRNVLLEDPDQDVVTMRIQLSDGREVELGNVRGPAGREITCRGTYAEDEVYWKLDLVSFKNQSWVARCDNPGPLPGDGWQLLAKRGPAGKQGRTGPAGPRGLPGLGFNWAGVYTIRDEGYAQGSVVRHMKGLWVALEDTRAVPGAPGVLDWDMMIDFSGE